VKAVAIASPASTVLTLQVNDNEVLSLLAILDQTNTGRELSKPIKKALRDAGFGELA